MGEANSGANSELIPEAGPGKRPRGNPNLVKGGPSLNPTGGPGERKWKEELAELERQREAERAEREEERAADQKRIAELEEKLADRGLREENKVLKGRVKELEAEVERLGRENAELRGRAAEQDDADPGADEQTGRIKKMLAELGEGRG